MKVVKLFFVGCTLLGLVPSQNANAQSEPSRVQRPLSLYASVGQPAPSLLGGAFGYQFSRSFQWMTSTGIYWNNAMKIQTLSSSLRLHLFPSELTPLLGAGVSAFFFHGKGEIQSLEASTLLGSFLVGADWAFAEALRLSGGLQFHYPIKLIFPFVELGVTF